MEQIHDKEAATFRLSRKTEIEAEVLELTSKMQLFMLHIQFFKMRGVFDESQAETISSICQAAARRIKSLREQH